MAVAMKLWSQSLCSCLETKCSVDWSRSEVPRVFGPRDTVQVCVTAQTALSSGGAQTVLPGRTRGTASVGLQCLVTWALGLYHFLDPGSWRYYAPPHPGPKPPEDREKEGAAWSVTSYGESTTFASATLT